MKSAVLVRLLSLLLACYQSSAQSSSISSIQQEYGQIETTLIERENRVKALVNENLPKVDAVLTELSTKTNIKLTIDALTKLKRILTDYATVSSYYANSTTLTCNEVVMKISDFLFDYQRVFKIKFNNDVNATWLLVEIGNLRVGYVANYFNLDDAQRQKIQGLTTSLTILYNEYIQYSVALALAMYKHARLYLELIIYKKNACNCPTQLSANSSATFTKIDANLKEIQTNVETKEANIRTTSPEVVAKVDAIISNIKLYPDFSEIAVALDALRSFSLGYYQVTTFDVVNATTNCDDAAKKLAYMQYKFELYVQMYVEAARNATFVLGQLNLLKVHYWAKTTKLTAAQKTGIEGVISSSEKLVENFRNYLLSLATSGSKLLVEIYYARLARSRSCDCSGGISASTSKFHWNVIEFSRQFFQFSQKKFYDR
jgi:hypothetical protein